MVGSDDSAWLRRFQPAPDASVRLVCLPHAGGSASFYLPVARALDGIEVQAVQYPGRQDRRREPFARSVTEIADSLAEVIASEPGHRPVGLFGHSMGATIAFEVGLRLEQAGIELRAAFLSGQRAPARHRFNGVHHRSDTAILDEIRNLDGTDSGLLDDDDVVRLILPSIRADYRILETYRPEGQVRLAAPIAAFAGASDPRVDVDDVRAWADNTRSEFTITVLPGGHFFLTSHLATMLGEIRGRLRTSETVRG